MIMNSFRYKNILHQVNDISLKEFYDLDQVILNGFK